MYDFSQPIVAVPTSEANYRSSHKLNKHKMRPKPVVPQELKLKASIIVLDTCTYMECRECGYGAFIPNSHFVLEN